MSAVCSNGTQRRLRNSFPLPNGTTHRRRTGPTPKAKIDEILRNLINEKKRHHPGRAFEILKCNVKKLTKGQITEYGCSDKIESFIKSPSQSDSHPPNPGMYYSIVSSCRRPLYYIGAPCSWGGSFSSTIKISEENLNQKKTKPKIQSIEEVGIVGGSAGLSSLINKAILGKNSNTKYVIGSAILGYSSYAAARAYFFNPITTPIFSLEDLRSRNFNSPEFSLLLERKNLLRDIEEALLIPQKPILLVGPSGCGKNVLVQFLAKRIHKGSCARELLYHQPYRCYAPEFSKHVDKVFSYLGEYFNKDSDNIIFFFDKFCSILTKENSQFSEETAEHLKEFSRKFPKIICTATKDEFNALKNFRLDEYFEVIEVSHFSVEELKGAFHLLLEQEFPTIEFDRDVVMDLHKKFQIRAAIDIIRKAAFKISNPYQNELNNLKLEISNLSKDSHENSQEHEKAINKKNELIEKSMRLKSMHEWKKIRQCLKKDSIDLASKRKELPFLRTRLLAQFAEEIITAERNTFELQDRITIDTIEEITGSGQESQSDQDES